MMRILSSLNSQIMRIISIVSKGYYQSICYERRLSEGRKEEIELFTWLVNLKRIIG